MNKSTSPKAQDVMSMLSMLESTLNDFFVKKAPSLPPSIVGILVTLAPYMTILSIIFAIPSLFAILGLSAIAAPFSLFSGGFMLSSAIAIIGLIATTILSIMAVSGLFAKKKTAWNKMFYVSLIGLVTSLLGGNLVSLILGTLISWYILFQIRASYK